MVLIKKDNTELTVSRGAYESFYRRCGFELVSAGEADESILTHENVHPENSQHIGDESMREDGLDEELEEEGDTDEELEEEGIDYSEIPLNELTFDQLCEYADQLGLDRDGIKSAKSLRALIKANR